MQPLPLIEAAKQEELQLLQDSAAAAAAGGNERSSVAQRQWDIAAGTLEFPVDNEAEEAGDWLNFQSE